MAPGIDLQASLLVTLGDCHFLGDLVVVGPWKHHVEVVC